MAIARNVTCAQVDGDIHIDRSFAVGPRLFYGIDNELKKVFRIKLSRLPKNLSIDYCLNYLDSEAGIDFNEFFICSDSQVEELETQQAKQSK